MPAQSDAKLISFGGWTLRVRAPAASPARLLLLIHGRTGDENSMWVFVRELTAAYSIVAPRALHVARPAGFSWVPASAQAHLPIGVEDLRASANSLFEMINDYGDAVGVPSADFDVMGFSEGGALSIVLALTHPERIRRMGVLAGFAPAGAEHLLAGPLLEGKPVFVAHGTQDQLVSVAASRESVRLLQRLGAQVTVCEAEIGHKVSAGCLRGLQSFFA